MQNRRERRRLLKQFGLLKSQTGKNAVFTNSLEEGKEIHRKHIQESVNQQMKKEIKSGKEPETDFFFYRNQENEYGNLQSMLLNKDWDQLEKD